MADVTNPSGREINFAELEHSMQHDPPLDACRRMGSTHHAYGWTPCPWGHWSDEQKEAYRDGYYSAKRGAGK